MGFNCGIVGLPNVGKSTLFNALTDSQQAIVTDIAGTTTDFMTGRLQTDAGTIELLEPGVS